MARYAKLVNGRDQIIEIKRARARVVIAVRGRIRAHELDPADVQAFYNARCHDIVNVRGFRFIGLATPAIAAWLRTTRTKGK